MTNLASAVYTAFRGYSWSRVPDGLTEGLMDRLRDLAAGKRGDFPDPDSVDRGVVAIGPVAAAFSIRCVPGWDSAGRASEYSAFVFFKSADAAAIDFSALLAHPFFASPTHDAPASIAYDGETAAVSPLPAAGQLLCRRHLDALPAAQCGDVLAKYFDKSEQWIFRTNNDGSMSVDCAEWKRKTETNA